MTNPLRKYVVNIITQLIRACLTGPCRYHAHFNHHKKSYCIEREQSLIIWEESCNMCLVTISTQNYSVDGKECSYRAGEHTVGGIVCEHLKVCHSFASSFLLSAVNWLTSAVCEKHNFATKKSLQGPPSASRQDRKVGTQLNFGLD